MMNNTTNKTRCWFGAVTGHAIPMARLAVAGMRATRRPGEDAGVEHFLDRNAEPDADLVADVCTAMARALRSLEDGDDDTVPLLPHAAIWVEPMGYNEKPDSDDYIIAIDLGTGDFCYDQVLAENPQARAGAAFCLNRISEFIKTRISTH